MSLDSEMFKLMDMGCVRSYVMQGMTRLSKCSRFACWLLKRLLLVRLRNGDEEVTRSIYGACESQSSGEANKKVSRENKL